MARSATGAMAAGASDFFCFHARRAGNGIAGFHSKAASHRYLCQ